MSRQLLQSDLDAEDLQRQATALSRLGQPSSWRQLGASAYWKSGASERRQDNSVTLVLSRYALVRTSPGVTSLAGDGCNAAALPTHPIVSGVETAAALALRQRPVSASGLKDGAAAAGRQATSASPTGSWRV